MTARALFMACLISLNFSATQRFLADFAFAFSFNAA
jgi:hypothetical protein